MMMSMDNSAAISAPFVRFYWRGKETNRTSQTPVGRILLPTAAAVGAGVIAAVLLRLLGSIPPPLQAPSLTWPWCAPFIALLAVIAWLPWKWPRVWEWIGFPISAGLSSLVAFAYGWRLHTLSPVADNIGNYIQFMAVIAAFYCVCTHLRITLHCRPTPLNNVILLLAAALLANIIGTCGATMLLIGPYLSLNRGRISAVHIFFFVAIAANIGGLLTPLGDPPLMAGYLYGVPFDWMLLHAWPMWCFAMAFLLSVFYLLQRRRSLDADSSALSVPARPIVEIENLWLMVPLAVCLIALFLPAPWRVGILAGVSAGLVILHKRPRETAGSAPVRQDDIGYGPLREMASLFLGLFITMTPVLSIITRLPPTVSGRLQSPPAYFFAVGAASSVLDNTPTYIAGLQLKAAAGTGSHSRLPLSMPSRKIAAMAANPRDSAYLLAIAMGAVMFGAMTWIGNGPNLLVEMIARRRGIQTPGFGAFLLRWAMPILLPLLVIIGVWLWLLTF